MGAVAFTKILKNDFPKNPDLLIRLNAVEFSTPRAFSDLEVLQVLKHHNKTQIGKKGK